MVVVDGRTDIEKLRELLATTTECSELDFKEVLDLTKKSDELHFVKDAVSMFNRYPGGYIIVGATNNGRPSELHKGIDWAQFDGARLTDKIRKYVDAPLTAISALHEIDGHKYALVCFRSLPEGLPTPFSKTGQYRDESDKPVFVFRPGDITRRDGAQNRPITYLQWSEILARHDAVVREDESKRINALVDKITLALGEKGKTPPLVYGMDEASLATTLELCLEQEETTKITRFINQLAIEVQHSDQAIETLTAVATHAIAYNNDAVFEAAASAIYDHYFGVSQFGVGADDTKMAILIACYEIGATLVLFKRWSMLSPFVNRRSPSYTANYYFSSWIRDCQVAAINSGRYGKNGAGTLISCVLDHVTRHARLLPDYDIGERTDDGKLSDAEEAMLDLLCCFDFLYCLCVFTMAGDNNGAYPSCVDFSESRIRPVVVKVYGSDDSVRKALLPGKGDQDIADATRALYYLISNEAMSGSKFVWGFDSTGLIRSFLDTNPPSDRQ